jgi:hypothetical protein
MVNSALRNKYKEVCTKREQVKIKQKYLLSTQHSSQKMNKGPTEKGTANKEGLVMKTKLFQIFLMVLAMVLFSAGASHVAAQVAPPDTTVCDGVTCDTVQTAAVCSAGFTISLTNYDPATTSNNGTATFTYEICSPPAGTCSNDASTSCLDNSGCYKNRCQTGGPDAGTCSQDDSTSCSDDATCNVGVTCSRDCATDKFYGLSHFDVTFPALGGVGSCLDAGTNVTGNCAAVDNTPSDGHIASVGSFVLGDAACDFGNTVAAKCDSTDLNPGDCLDMTVYIPGETAGFGLGAAVLVDKEATSCTASCVAGPSCDPCEGVPPGGACLTRTIGFWGTHPDIAALYDPVTVCGFVVNGQLAKACSTSEALCSSSNDYKQNPTYLSLVAQLTAAKLNLNATAALSSGGLCSSWSYGGMTIQSWIGSCEATYCNTKKQIISTSGCIEALTAFNESQDTGFDVTPPPFDSPGPANINQCQLARGNGKYIGAGLCGQ